MKAEAERGLNLPNFFFFGAERRSRFFFSFFDAEACDRRGVFSFPRRPQRRLREGGRGPGTVFPHPFGQSRGGALKAEQLEGPFAPLFRSARAWARRTLPFPPNLSHFFLLPAGENRKVRRSFCFFFRSPHASSAGGVSLSLFFFRKA